MISEYFPKTADELQQATILLCMGYLSLTYAIHGAAKVFGGRTAEINSTAKVFDAFTFASSALAIASVFSKDVLTLMGDLRIFLSIAGLCGGVYSLHALFKA